MDFEQDNSHLADSHPADSSSGTTGPQPTEPISGLGAGRPRIEPQRKGAGWRIFWGIVLALSVMANVALFVMLIGVVAIFATGQRGLLTEEVIREGPARTKIAMVTVQGIIHGQVADDVYRQLKAAREDKRVKGIIVRVNSPGGTISASDQIYTEIIAKVSYRLKNSLLGQEGLTAMEY